MFNGDSKIPVLADDENSILKPKLHVSIEGTPKGDKIKGGTGDDTIYGKFGHDILRGEDGNDNINGGIGQDKITGQAGNDVINGEKGDDIIFGGQGYDKIYGSLGNDALDGGEGKDLLIGGKGSDTFICNQYDIVMDYNANEKDQLVGSCKVQAQEAIAVSDSNIQPTPKPQIVQSTITSSSLLQPETIEEKEEQKTPILPINANDALPNFEPILRFNPNDLTQVDFQTLPSLPIPFNERDNQELKFN
jgi:Ca2+-binding RTX toxin-like protein